VYLLDASTDYEAGLLRRWLEKDGGGDLEAFRISSSRRGSGGDTEDLARVIGMAEDPYLIPLRVVWLVPEKRGRRSVSLWDVLRPGDPRDPKGIRARWIRMARPGRVRLVAARGAHASTLAEAHQVSGQVDPVTSFVTRRAWLVLDQAERRLRGNRYKVPRFVPEAILSRREFLDAVDAVAADTSMAPAIARDKAEQYLREIAATHSPYVIDLIANAIHKLYSQGYGEIKYSDEQVKRLAALPTDRIWTVSASSSCSGRTIFHPTTPPVGSTSTSSRSGRWCGARESSSSAGLSRTTISTRRSYVPISITWSRSGSRSSGTWKGGGRARGS
jgi:hypothetical protein